MLARVCCEPSLQQQDRLPISTYDEAVRRLVEFRNDPAITDEAYDLAVSLVADVFWTADKRVRRDVVVAARQLAV